jgi:protein SCO1/2
MRHSFFYILTWLLTASLGLSFGCKPKQLPVLGERQAITKTVNEQTVTDTVYHTIPEFRFVDQDRAVVTQATFEGKIYVADFFFTTCPTICPLMRTQLLRVYEKFKDNPQVGILSHSIDPEHDSVPVLKEYAESIGIDSQKWHLVTGDKDSIYQLGQTSYMVTAQEDKTAAGGVIHSGAFILVDKQRRIRGIYDGTNPAEVDRLLTDMETLLAEYDKA